MFSKVSSHSKGRQQHVSYTAYKKIYKNNWAHSMATTQYVSGQSSRLSWAYAVSANENPF